MDDWRHPCSRVAVHSPDRARRGEEAGSACRADGPHDDQSARLLAASHAPAKTHVHTLVSHPPKCSVHGHNKQAPQVHLPGLWQRQRLQARAVCPDSGAGAQTHQPTGVAAWPAQVRGVALLNFFLFRTRPCVVPASGRRRGAGMPEEGPVRGGPLPFTALSGNRLRPEPPPPPLPPNPKGPSPAIYCQHPPCCTPCSAAGAGDFLHGKDQGRRCRVCPGQRGCGPVVP